MVTTGAAYEVVTGAKDWTTGTAGAGRSGATSATASTGAGAAFFGFRARFVLPARDLPAVPFNATASRKQLVGGYS